MTWWDIAPLVMLGAKARLPAWGLDRRIIATAGAGTTVAVFQIESLSATGVVISRRTVQANEFGVAEFSATNWEVIA